MSDQELANKAKNVLDRMTEANNILSSIYQEVRDASPEFLGELARHPACPQSLLLVVAQAPQTTAETLRVLCERPTLSAMLKVALASNRLTPVDGLAVLAQG
jgi:hypothetical protein